MKWVTFDISPILFNGVNYGHSSLRWLIDLVMYAAKEIVYLPPHTPLPLNVRLRLEEKHFLYQLC